MRWDDEMTTIDHHLTEALLMSYSAGTLPEAFNLAVAAHVSMCDQCRAALDSYDAVGGVLMGFGSMLAGGCAVGAGITGGAILALTAWVAVFCMWVGAIATQWLMTSRAARPAAAA